MKYAEALIYLEQHYTFDPADRTTAPSLARMEDLVAVMADPHLGIPTIHVTGTNGKGSTSRIAIDLLAAHNLHVGGYSSPHLERVNERITSNGEPLTDEEFAAAIELVATVEPLLEDKWGSTVTYFEVTSAAALGWHAETACDARVIEVGLGGTWDATNVLDADVAVVTNVALDHVETLGPTRSDIAREKAGIISPSSTVIVGEEDPQLLPIFQARENAGLWSVGNEFELIENRLAVGGRSIDVRTPFGEYRDVFVSLNGAHQGRNALLALAAVESFFGRALDPDLVAEVLANVSMAARFEVVGHRPLTIIDGAHNPDGATAATETLYSDFSTEEPPVLVAGFNVPRDPHEMLLALGADRAKAVVATSADWSKALPADEVSSAASEMCDNVVWVPDIGEAVDAAQRIAGAQGTVFIAGSLFVAGAARRHLVG